MKMELTVNQMEFTDDTTRKPRNCGQCGKPTTGRVERKPICLDCAMVKVLAPLRKGFKALVDGR